MNSTYEIELSNQEMGLIAELINRGPLNGVQTYQLALGILAKFNEYSQPPNLKNEE